MTRVVLGLIATVFLISCSEKKVKTIKSENPIVTNQSFFYVYDTIPKVYQYRELVNGMYEQFHRVYGVRDGYGRHIIVERYTQEGRLTEAYNFNLDSLNVIDHMVVNVKGEKEKATVYKDKLFPLGKNEIHFASKFSGITDMKVILYESFRKVNTFTKRNILSKNMNCMKLNERIRVTNIDLELKKESKPLENQLFQYYGKGLGLVEWHDKNLSQHYVLEKIISQREWIKLISG